MSEHEKTRQHLAALAAGGLTPAEEAEARAHLIACAACAREFSTWARLATAIARQPASALPAASVARIAARAHAHRADVLEKRWNRLVLTGLVLYGWVLFIVVWPLLPTVVNWLGDQLTVPWFVVIILGLGLWWSFCWVIGLGLLPLLRQAEKVDLEEKVT